MNDSFEEEFRRTAANNAQLLSSNLEDQPLLARCRAFPRDCAIQPTTEEEIMYTRDEPEYALDPTQLPQQPDPWKFENNMYSDFWEGEQDKDESLHCTEEWFEYIEVPITTLYLLRAMLNNLIDTIEIRGFLTPIGLLKNFGD